MPLSKRRHFDALDVIKTFSKQRLIVSFWTTDRYERKSTYRVQTGSPGRWIFLVKRGPKTKLKTNLSPDKKYEIFEFYFYTRDKEPENQK